MHRKSTAELLRDDLRDLVDAVVPEVESAVQTVAERTPPLVHKGRAVAAEKGAHAAEMLSRHLPDQVVDRLPDAVSDRLPQPHRRSRKALLVLLTLGIAGIVGVMAAKRRKGSGPTHAAPSSAPSYPRAVEEETDTSGSLDPSDPLVEPRVNGTQA
ncbi:hypothetical protein ACJ5H2_09300 [Nocardioides sp. R1-1]|uniref:hypothetical protein n=1 Tax=Nocardioides sp. R1-1 TaxID=3383502 RepID=UPI0038D223AE